MVMVVLVREVRSVVRQEGVLELIIRHVRIERVREIINVAVLV